MKGVLIFVMAALCMQVVKSGKPCPHKHKCYNCSTIITEFITVQADIINFIVLIDNIQGIERNDCDCVLNFSWFIRNL